MTRTERKHLVVLLTGLQIFPGPRGIEFSPGLGHELLAKYVIEEPVEFILKYHDRLFLKRGVHTTRELADTGLRVITKIIRYVQVDFTVLDAIIEKELKTCHEPLAPYAKVTPDGISNPRAIPVQCLSCCHFFKAEILFDNQSWQCPHRKRKNYWVPKE